MYIVMYLCNSIIKTTLKSYRSAHTGLRSHKHNIDIDTKLRLNYSLISAKLWSFFRVCMTDVKSIITLCIEARAIKF